MSTIFITGSADGLGKMAAQLLVAQGHSVTLHARSPQRAKEALAEHLRDAHPAAVNSEVQEKFLAECARISGVAFPPS
jgi:NAD(P)-dependent dehydrogenase (short-subunit alcohol dehydrogenase family)